MIRNYAVSTALLTSLITSTITHSQEKLTMNKEQKSVISAIETMTAAFHKQDIENVMAAYEKGAAIMFEPGQQSSDPILVKKMFQGFFQLNPSFIYPQGHEVYIANDIALHISPWKMRGTSSEGQDIEQSGLSVAVLRKQVDGQWLLVLDNPHGQLLLEQ